MEHEQGDTPWKAEFQEFVNMLRAKYRGQIIGVCCAYLCPGKDTKEGHMALVQIDVAGATELTRVHYAATFHHAGDIIEREMTQAGMKPWPKAN